MRTKLLKYLLFLSICVVMPPKAHADWCRKPDGGVEQCASHPSSWTNCGSFNGETIYCFQQGSISGSKSHSSGDKATQKVLISVGIGLAVIAVGYYFFKKKPSQNNPGQISLMEF